MADYPDSINHFAHLPAAIEALLSKVELEILMVYIHIKESDLKLIDKWECEVVRGLSSLRSLKVKPSHIRSWNLALHITEQEEEDSMRDMMMTLKYETIIEHLIKPDSLR